MKHIFRFNFIAPILVIFCLITLTKAQSKTSVATAKNQPCLLKVKDSPVIRGLHLGMTRAEVEKEYPNMVFTGQMPKDETKRKGVPAGTVKKAEITNPVYKENLDQVSIILNKDNKILTISYIFDDLISGSSLKNLSEKMSELINIPTTQWSPSPNGNMLVIRCDGFAIATGLSDQKKQLLFLAKDPQTLTEEERKILQP